MRLKTASLKAWKKACTAAGIKELPPDHPIYSEGPSVIFMSSKEEPLRHRINELDLAGKQGNPSSSSGS